MNEMNNRWIDCWMDKMDQNDFIILCNEVGRHNSNYTMYTPIVSNSLYSVAFKLKHIEMCMYSFNEAHSIVFPLDNEKALNKLSFILPNVMQLVFCRF
jgi:hypothetical protein